jgi:hypothetical protein
VAIYIVAYDLNKEDKHPNIVAEIKKLGHWARLSESSYAIDTSERPPQVKARLKKYLDCNDNLYVIALTVPWSGFGPKDVNEWVEARLGLGE